ncbi:MAG: hypothetical protein HY561_13155 [Gemmatimonadetes bacterium]|nr:hypothetical protein [Gemmatimonadota bacterium]
MLRAFLHERLLRREHRLDLLGTVTLTAAVTLLLVAFLEGSEAWGWASPLTLACLIGAGGGLALLLWQEQRAREPMLPLGLFRTRLMAACAATFFFPAGAAAAHAHREREERPPVMPPTAA